MEALLHASALSLTYDYVIIKEGNVRETCKVHCTIFSSFVLLTVELTQFP